MDITGIGEAAQAAKSIIGMIFPDKTESEKAQLSAALSLIQAQTDTNKVEAANPSVFVAGWRPWIGWVCGFALAYVAVFEPVGRFIALVWFHYSGAFPVIDTTITLQILLGMLGLGGMRSVEKIKGVA